MDDPDVPAPIPGGRGRGFAGMDAYAGYQQIGYLGHIVGPAAIANGNAEPSAASHHEADPDEADSSSEADSDASAPDSLPDLEPDMEPVSTDFCREYNWPMRVRVYNLYHGEITIQLNQLEAEMIRQRSHYTWAQQEQVMHDLLPAWVQSFNQLETYITENFRDARLAEVHGAMQTWRSRHCHYTGYMMVWDPMQLAHQNLREGRVPATRNQYFSTHGVEYKIMATTVDGQLTHVLHDIYPRSPRW